jgi:hypothetical protein
MLSESESGESGEAARSTRIPPPEAEWLDGYWLHSKPLGDCRGDKSQERIAETGDHDTEHGKPDAQRDCAIRRSDSDCAATDRLAHCGARSTLLYKKC